MATMASRSARPGALLAPSKRPIRFDSRRTRSHAKRASSASAAPTVEWDKVAEELDQASPLEIIDYALKTFGDEVAIAFSGAEDVAVIEYASLTGRPFRVFSLDTGRLNPETYRLFDKVEKHYGIHIEYMFPDTAETEELVRTKGMFSFYEDGHQECCRVRKVRPLRRALRGLKAWITGQRKDQSPGTRAAVPVVQVDPVFEGMGGAGSLIKFNPVSNISSAETWAFLRTMGVPVNDLHFQGYDSIGCEPCTRPVLPNQHEREGRWWWEDATAKECGLHSGNVVDSAVEGAKVEAADLYTSSSVKELCKEEMNAMATSGSDVSTLAVIYAPWCQFCQALEPAYEEVAEQLQASGVRVGKFRGDTDRDFVADRFQLQTFPKIVIFPKAGAKEFVVYPSERRDVDNLLAFVHALQ